MSQRGIAFFLDQVRRGPRQNDGGEQICATNSSLADPIAAARTRREVISVQHADTGAQSPCPQSPRRKDRLWLASSRPRTPSSDRCASQQYLAPAYDFSDCGDCASSRALIDSYHAGRGWYRRWGEGGERLVMDYLIISRVLGVLRVTIAWHVYEHHWALQRR